jgi:hypothetical protein
MNRCLCLGVLLLAAPVIRADDADARKIIEKAVKAEGRSEKDLPKAVSYKVKGNFYGMGMEMPFTGTWATQYPDKTRMEIENLITVVVNGNKGWMSAMGAEMELPEDELKEHQESLYGDWVSELTPLLNDKSFTLSAAGEAKVDDKTTVAVKVSHKDRRDITLHFEKDGGLLVKMDQTVKDEMGGGDVKQETFIKEYSTVGKVKVATKLLVKRDGKDHVDAEVSDYKESEKLPASTFEKP